MRVLIANSDAAAARFLAGVILRDEAVVEFARDQADLLHHLDVSFFSVLVTEYALGGVNGPTLLRSVRGRGHALPILVHSALRDPSVRASCLAHGADAILAKPADPEELRAHVRALARRGAALVTPTIRCGRVTFLLDERTAATPLASVQFTPSEFLVVRELLARAGMTVAKERLTAALSGGDLRRGDTRLIDTYIMKIRRKLAGIGADTSITTVCGQGYRIGDAASEAAQAVDRATIPVPFSMAGAEGR